MRILIFLDFRILETMIADSNPPDSNRFRISTRKHILTISSFFEQINLTIFSCETTLYFEMFLYSVSERQSRLEWKVIFSVTFQDRQLIFGEKSLHHWTMFNLNIQFFIYLVRQSVSNALTVRWFLYWKGLIGSATFKQIDFLWCLSWPKHIYSKPSWSVVSRSVMLLLWRDMEMQKNILEPNPDILKLK